MKLSNFLREELSVRDLELDDRWPTGTCNGELDFEHRGITSLVGCPRIVNGNFRCNHNKLSSLEGGPEKVSGLYAAVYCSLESLVGIPAEIEDGLYVYKNKLTSLKGIHKLIKRARGMLNFRDNPITSHVLGLLKIEGSFSVNLADASDARASRHLKGVEKIINRHLGLGSDILVCQEELIDAGFEEFAQL